MTGRRIPFHRSAEARINVRNAFGKTAELERRPRGKGVGDIMRVDEGLRRVIHVRPADGGRKPGGRGRARSDRI